MPDLLRCPACGRESEVPDTASLNAEYPAVLQFTGEWFCNCSIAEPQRLDWRGRHPHGPQLEPVTKPQ